MVATILTSAEEFAMQSLPVLRRLGAGLLLGICMIDCQQIDRQEQEADAEDQRTWVALALAFPLFLCALRSAFNSASDPSFTCMHGQEARVIKDKSYHPNRK